MTLENNQTPMTRGSLRHGRFHFIIYKKTTSLPAKRKTGGLFCEGEVGGSGFVGFPVG